MEKVDKKRDMVIIKMIIKRKYGKNEIGEWEIWIFLNGYMDLINN